jgi:hypothetical protein
MIYTTSMYNLNPKYHVLYELQKKQNLTRFRVHYSQT